MTAELALLALTAAAIGGLHTVIGPDHYVPFIVLARARRWSLPRTLAVTTVCGLGHVTASLVLGGIAVSLGWAAARVDGIDRLRGGVAAWLLIGFGLAYAVWGLRQARRRRPHRHWHVHEDGTAHDHTHDHRGAHVHVHESPSARSLTPWLLFLLFIFGPCEALIPLLMAPAATGAWLGVGVVALSFTVATVGAMAGLVVFGYLGLSRLAFGRLERYSQAAAGVALALCGLAIRFGF